YALLGRPDEVSDSLALAEREHERCLAAGAQHGDAPLPVSRLWGDPDQLRYGIAGVAGMAHFQLACHRTVADAGPSAEAAAHILSPLLDAAGRGRPHALAQIMLASSLLRAGKREAGVALAHAAVDQVWAIRSLRAVERLDSPATAARTWPRHPDAIDLRRRIA